MPAETLLMALGVGVVVGSFLGIGLVGLIGANREQAAPSTLPPRSVNGATLDAVFVHHARGHLRAQHLPRRSPDRGQPERRPRGYAELEPGWQPRQVQRPPHRRLVRPRPW